MWHALLYVLAYHAVGILVYGHLENWGPLDTSYFLTVTATTVGYGDLTPTSDAGKAFTVVYALLGVFLVFDVLTSLFADVVKNTAWREGLLDWCTPGVSLRARRVDTNDPTLTVDEVNRRVDYSLRYALAFVPPVVCLLLGIIVGHVSDVQAGEARDKRILAAIEAGNERNASIRRNVHELGGALRKTKSRELVKRMKEAALGQSELELEDVEELPFAEGGQGAVFRGYLGGEIVCLKKISMVGVPAVKRTKMLSSFKTELGIMIRLRHPRTVQVLGVVTTNPTFLGLVMEYLPGGSLRHALDRDDEMITPEYQRFWTADVALGMAHLYSCKIEHRDLKTHNVLLTHDGRCKVTDFGLSRCEELKTFTTTATMRDSVAGTPAFMAPELFEDNTFTEKSDVYSYAVVLWEIYDRGIPWSGLMPAQIISKVIVKHARPTRSAARARSSCVGRSTSCVAHLRKPEPKQLRKEQRPRRRHASRLRSPRARLRRSRSRSRSPASPVASRSSSRSSTSGSAPAPSIVLRRRMLERFEILLGSWKVTF